MKELFGFSELSVESSRLFTASLEYGEASETSGELSSAESSAEEFLAASDAAASIGSSDGSA